uniref:Class I SAM-dependent methyltransferase n=1 Tax=candidate division WOR-3 bacterium TaxID=2052148 RepID=A0A7V4ABI5_UNCW3
MKEPTLLECPVCQTKKEESAFIETYISPFNNQEYKLYHCETCDLQWWEPLKIIPEFYEGEGEEGYKTFHLGLREEIGENHKMFFEYFPLKSGKLLDVGCGDGVFLKEAQKAGFEVWGIDFDSKSIRVCQEKWGLKNTFAMSPQEFAKFCQKEGLKFDVITFFEVLEHQDRPVEFLEAIKSMLKPGGYIAGSVPNRDSWMWRMSGRKISKGDFPPHHFLRFSKEALAVFIKKMGFIEIFIKPTPVKISEVAFYFQLLITGERINRFLRKTITTHELAGEGTSIYKKLPTWRKAIFKGLKGLRFGIFLFPALVVKYVSEGMLLYFQSRSKHGK